MEKNQWTPSPTVDEPTFWHEDMRIMDPRIKRHVDVVHLVLMSYASRSVIPELYEIFGKEAMIKFIDIFAGCTFRVPSREVFERAVMDTEIYLEYCRTPLPSTIDSMATRYAVTEGEIWRSVGRVNTICRAMEKQQESQ